MTPDQTLALQTEARKPTRVQSAFLLYSNAVREAVTKGLKGKTGGKCKLGDIAKDISSRWAALAREDKQMYEDKAAEDRQRYVEELRVYQEACDVAGALRKKYEVLIPKRPASAATRFLQDAAVRERAAKELGGESAPKMVDGKVRELWKAAREDERRPYEEAVEKDKAEFFQRQKVWQATPEFAEIERAEKEEERRKQGDDKAKEGGEAAKHAGAKKAAAKTTPQSKTAKRQQADKENVQPASEPKRARKTKDAAPAGVVLDTEVVAEAAKLSLEGALRNLAGRPDVVASGKAPAELLAALQASGGLVNPAKRALLGL